MSVGPGCQEEEVGCFAEKSSGVVACASHGWELRGYFWQEVEREPGGRHGGRKRLC